MEDKKKRNRYTFEMLNEAIPRHTSWNSLVRELKGGAAGNGNSQGHFKNLAIRWGIDFSHFTGKNWAKGVPSSKKLSTEEALKDFTGSDRIQAPSARLMRRSLLEAGVEHACRSCGLGVTWNGKPLRLQVDHIDGNRFNCLISNLQFLCPNCHSQTHNWGIKNSPSFVVKDFECVDCGERRGRNAARCKPCSVKHGLLSEENVARSKSNTKIQWPSIEELQELVNAFSFLEVGRRLGVSDVAVKKRLLSQGGVLPSSRRSVQRSK